MASPPTKSGKPSITIQLIVINFGRWLINTVMRFPYPFLPELARGLGVPLIEMGRLLAFASLAGFFSPAFGNSSDRYGRRKVMVWSMRAIGFSCLIVVLFPSYWILALVLFAIALFRAILDPAMQSWIGERIPYERRGKALALSEYAWGLSLLVGAPLTGWLMSRFGWNSPFLWLGLGIIMASSGVALVLPKASRKHSDSLAPSKDSVWRVLIKHPVVWAMTISIMFLMAATDVFFIVYGDWMESRFSLSLTQLGLATGVIGFAELLGSSVVAWASDRFGKRQVVALFGCANVLIYLLIPLMSTSAMLALLGMFLLFLAFETTIVGSIPLISELVPESRAAVMSIYVAAGALGRAMGALIGPLVWNGESIWSNGIVAAVFCGVAMAVMIAFVKERQQTSLAG